mgnify:FL=1
MRSTDEPEAGTLSTRRASTTAWLAALLVAITLTACGKKADEPDAPAAVVATTPAQPETKDPPPVQPPAGPFVAPPLAELEQSATWIDRPVKDGLVMLREQQAQETQLCSVADALALANDSAAANAKILSALGRLPEPGAADMAARIERHVTGDLGSTNPIMISTTAEFDILEIGRAHV